MHPRHLEMATSAALEAEGRALALSARQTENWSYTQEIGSMAVKGHGSKKEPTSPLLQGISYCESDPILKLPSGRWPDQKSISNQR